MSSGSSDLTVQLSGTSPQEKLAALVVVVVEVVVLLFSKKLLPWLCNSILLVLLQLPLLLKAVLASQFWTPLLTSQETVEGF